jgi:tetratricopeptide (TPR) repeat protein
MEDAARDFATYPRALADLDEAIRFWPENWLGLHERGYLYNEYGRWKDAEADLDRQIGLNPTYSDGYQERALAKFGLGDLQGAEADRTAGLLLDPDNPQALLARARARMWLGRFNDARADVEQASEFAKKAKNTDALKDVEALNADIMLWTTVSDPAHSKAACLDAKTEADFYKPTFIGDCTRTFLDAKTNKEKADALTQRLMMMPVAKQQDTAGLDDARVAYALDPDNPDHLTNLGSQLVAANRNRQAIHYLDESIKQKGTHVAYSARAAAKLHLGDINGAFFDAKKAFEIEPDEVALTVLGDCIYAKEKKYDNAKIYWIGAYHLGDRDDGLIA